MSSYRKIEKKSVLSGTILYEKERSKIWYVGGSFNFKTGSPSHSYIGKDINNRDISLKLTSVTYLSGCEMLIPIDAINEVGLLSDDYFLYWEDTDYSIRLMNGGYHLYYAPESIIYHKVSSSTSKESKTMQYYSVRNRRIIIKKYIKGINKVIAYIFTFLQTINRILKGKLTVKCVTYGIIDYYKGERGKTKRKL